MDFAAMMRENLEKQKEGAGGWKSLVPGVKKQNDEAVDEGESMLKIFDAMSAEQLACKAPINIRTRNRIASGSGRSLAEVDSVLQNFSMLKMMHKWLHMRTKVRFPSPASRALYSKIYDLRCRNVRTGAACFFPVSRCARSLPF